MRLVEAGASASPGLPTLRMNAWPTVYGPFPVLLSVADTFKVKLPDWVGVPETVTLLAVLLVIDKPAGRFVT